MHFEISWRTIYLKFYVKAYVDMYLEVDHFGAITMIIVELFHVSCSRKTINCLHQTLNMPADIYEK